MTGHQNTEEIPTPAGRSGRWLRLGLLVLVFGTAAELFARLDDTVFHGSSFLGTPSEEDLWMRDAIGRHGRPNARFLNARLNSFGLMGPEPATEPCRRILFVGGSETFGVPQIANGSYTDVFRERFRVPGCLQVLNGAIPGMTAYTMISYYRDWAARSRPTQVVIYPSTHFYLSSEAPGPRPKSATTAVARGTDERNGDFGLLDRSRLFARLRNALAIPGPIQRIREKRWIDAELAGKPAGWIFTTVPADRLELLRVHLRELIAQIRLSGAEPVLVTHAVSPRRPPVEDDRARTEAMRVWMPRATSEVIAEFPYRANDVIREVASMEGVQLIDAAAVLAGHPDRFVDLVHFSDTGRKIMGELIADALRPAPQER